MRKNLQLLYMINLYRLNTSALQEQIHFCNEQSYSRELMTQRYDESYKLHYQALVCTVWEYKMRIARYKYVTNMYFCLENVSED